MTLVQKSLLAAAISFCIGLSAYALAAYHIETLSAQTAGEQSSVYIATTTEVGPQQNKTLFTSNTLCTSRVISTAASPLMLSLGESVNPNGVTITPTGSLGHIQAASTTVAYPAELFGCGTVTAYAFSSSTITTAELR